MSNWIPPHMRLEEGQKLSTRFEDGYLILGANYVYSDGTFVKPLKRQQKAIKKARMKRYE